MLPGIDTDLPTDAARRARSLDRLEKATRAAARADELKALLPDAIRTPDDARAFTVWWGTRERAWGHHKAAMEEWFGELEDDGAALRAAKQGRLDELGRRVKDFVDFCETEVAPRLARIEKGLDLCARDPRPEYLAAIAGLRQKVREALPHAWALASPAAHLYRLLDEPHREEAERRWGPLTGTDPHDFSPMWRTHFPTERLRRVDERLKALQETTDE